MEIITSTKGRTVALEKIIKNSFENNDFIFIDGKGDVELLKQIQDKVVAERRDEEVLVLDFFKK